MSEIFPPPWKRKKKINLNMDSKNNSMHLCIMNVLKTILIILFTIKYSLIL